MANPLLNSPALTAGEPITAKPKVNSKKSGFQKNTYGPKIKKPKAHRPKTPITPKTQALDPQVAALLNAAVRMRFAPQEQALGRQMTANSHFAQGLPQWYAQAVQQIRGIQPPQPIVAPAHTGDEAQDSRNVLQASFDQSAAMRQNNASDFSNAVKNGLLAQQGNQQFAAYRQGLDLQNQQRALGAQKGEFKTTFLANQQAAQDKANMEQAKINASLAIASGKVDLARDILNNVTKPKAQAQIKQGRSNVRTQRMNAKANQQRANQQGQKTQREIAYFDKHGHWPSTAKANKMREDQRKKNAELKDQTSRGAAVLRQYIATLKGKSVPQRQTLVDMLETSKHGISHVAAVRAVNKVLASLPSPGAGLGGPYGTGHMEN